MIFKKSNIKEEISKRPLYCIPEYSVPYHGRSAIGNFLFKYIYGILALSIPLFVYFTLLKNNRIAPFDSQLLSTPEAIQNEISILYNSLNQIKSGNSSLLQPVNHSALLACFAIFPYCLSPARLCLLLLAPSRLFSGLYIITGLQVAVAGFTMWIYLTKRPLQPLSIHNPLSLALSLCYALSSYTLVQCVQYSVMECVCLYPLVFLFYEQWKYNNSSTYFRFLITYLLICNPQIATSIFLVFSIYSLCQSADSFKAHFQNLISYFILVLPCILLAAFSILSCISAHVYSSSKATVFTQSGIWGDSLMNTFTRLFPFSLPSYQLNTTDGINLYCGLPIFLLAASFCFNLVISKRKIHNKLFALTFVALIFLSLVFIPLQRALTPLWLNDYTFYPATYIVVFFMIQASVNTILYFKDTKGGLMLTSLLIAGTATVLSFSLSPYYPTGNMLLLLSLIISYSILIILVYYRSISAKVFIALLSTALCCELLFNAFTTVSAGEESATEMYSYMTTSLQTLTHNPYIEKSGEEMYANSSIADYILPSFYFIPGSYSEQTEASTDSIADTFNKISLSVGMDQEPLTPYYPHFTINPDSITISDDGKGSLTLTPPAQSVYPIFSILHATAPADGDILLFLNRCYSLGSKKKGNQLAQAISVEENDTPGNQVVINGIAGILDTELFNSHYNKLSKSSFSITSISPFRISISGKTEENGTLIAPFSSKAPLRYYANHERIQHFSDFNSNAAISLPAGQNDITIKYFDPLQFAGFLLSILTSAVLVYRHKKQSKTQES